MYSEQDIDSAIAAGALSECAAASFRAHVAAAKGVVPSVDEEAFRLLTGFNDVFVSIAAVLMLVATGWIGNEVRLLADPMGPSPFMGFAIATAAWCLAEYFTRQRRMALPSIILLLAFAGGLMAGFSLLFSAMSDADQAASDRQAALATAASAAFTAGAVWLHWRRFMVPITVAAGAAVLSGLAISLIIAAVPALWDHVLVLMLVAGVAIFALAMRWDMSDRTRATRRSDVAFWLHLLAAPMMVHPVFALLGILEGATDPAEAIAVVLLYVSLGLVALAIDRRALMVSALVYVLYALSSLIESSGAVNLSFGLTALIIGSALLLLSAFWSVARRRLVALLPTGFALRLPVTERSQAA